MLAYWFRSVHHCLLESAKRAEEMDLNIAGYALSGLEKFNVILGKNGCGKSTLLRALDQADPQRQDYYRYITPERGGNLIIDGNVESNIQNLNWLLGVRRQNRFEQFRQISVAEFRRLETLVLRKIEKDEEVRQDVNFTFDTILAQMNDLLDHVELVRADNAAFKVRRKGEDQWSDVTTLSSGESELISLAIEVLSFAFTVDQEQYHDKVNWLLLDEPDVHLHPDLQHRFMRMLMKAFLDKPGRLLIATHSTSIVSALSEQENARVALMKSGQKDLQFERIDDAMKAVLPIFGAHPLSNVFNDKPIMLVEGGDDERIWQQAVRSSQGAIRIWPCAAGDVQSLNEYESKARSVLEAVYDTAMAYSVRDRDDGPYEIENQGPIIRARLNCRAAENLLLSNDVLASLGIDWNAMIEAFEKWIKENPEHPQIAAFASFQKNGWDRRNAVVKPLRNIVMAIAGSEKPWEVAVGQAIAHLSNGAGDSAEHSLRDYLGPKLVNALSLAPKEGAADKAA